MTVLIDILNAYGLEIASVGTFIVGFSIYSYVQLKSKVNKYKVQYCDVSSVIRQYKMLDKRLNDGIGGNKNDKFFN